MIIIKLKGGLGNQLFQYAFGRLLSIKNSVLVKYEFLVLKGDAQREYKLEYFNTKIEFPTPEEIKKIKYPYGIFYKIGDFIKKKILGQYNIGYIPSALNKKSGYLEGYWQSYKYLDPIRNILLKEITLKEPVENKYGELLNQIYDADSISIHIRRGDYVNDPKTKAIHCTFGLEYYQDAIKMIKEKISNPTFFVFSDDIKWVKQNLKIDFPAIFVSNPKIKDYGELIIMSKCKNNIIANSSFSFWGAWLNQNPNKIVIAPQKWNNKYQKDYKDLLPKEWIQI
ncbi:Glycosyl transferase family 11 [groundwater metagenome]|uniref:Glycosyl transferase family 11 n=1 Tax=groundwater metagenome TaxID=717931 RepID=A0A098EFM8_9ZZZZ